MNLKRLRAHWDAWGREDPFWAILTEPDKRGNRWDSAALFATGVAEIDGIMAELSRLAPAMRTGAALDFGCGAGRLTQALATHFDRVVGVDIAPSMISLANESNRCGERCRYVVNADDDLSAFADASVDLVLSLITLQHMESRYAKRYIAEFVRVTAPGGLVYFQIPASRAAFPERTPWLKRAKARLRAATPDALASVYDDIKGRVVGEGPRMEGRGVPEAVVTGILEGAGADLLRVWDDQSAGPDWISRRYCARRRHGEEPPARSEERLIPHRAPEDRRGR